MLSGACRQRFWITCFRRSRICKCGCSGKCTFESVYNVVAWSMRALLLRRWPTRDHLNNKWPVGSWRAEKARQPLRIGGAVIRHFGDWEYMKNAIGLTGWSDGPRQLCCWLCQACRLGAPYAFDATLGADWRATAVTAHEWWMQVFLGAARFGPPSAGSSWPWCGRSRWSASLW